INATGTLTLNTGNTIINAGLLEATAGGTLDIKDAVTNTGTVQAGGTSTTGTVVLEGVLTNTTGTLKAAGGSTIDVKASNLTNQTATTGITLVGSGDTLTVDVTAAGHTLLLNGGGGVSLGAGSKIIGTAG